MPCHNFIEANGHLKLQHSASTFFFIFEKYQTIKGNDFILTPMQSNLAQKYILRSSQCFLVFYKVVADVDSRLFLLYY